MLFLENQDPFSFYLLGRGKKAELKYTGFPRESIQLLLLATTAGSASEACICAESPLPEPRSSGDAVVEITQRKPSKQNPETIGKQIPHEEMFALFIIF